MPQTGTSGTPLTTPSPPPGRNALTTRPAPAPALTFHVRPPSGRHRIALRVLRAFCEALFSTRDGPPPKDRLDWLIGELDDYITCAGWRSGGIYKLGLVATNFIAPLFIGTLVPLWSLPIEARVRALTKMEHSPLAVVVLGLRTIICITWYDHPDSQREICYTGGTLLPVDGAQA
ncbi:MAG: hypothetical protein IRZ16_13065 [Myxococcaceae bacterium]|nr:hypothetical protein [Myxococcaceae bacterium]